VLFAQRYLEDDASDVIPVSKQISFSGRKNSLENLQEKSTTKVAPSSKVLTSKKTPLSPRQLKRADTLQDKV
jgi:hypothetical protein